MGACEFIEVSVGVGSRPVMKRWRAIAALVLLVFPLRSASACSCSNNTPIQASSDRYRDRAVFTAHIVQLMGRINNWDGKRFSGQALALVNKRYWGIPWYWPKVVVLDGGLLCNIVLEEGKDYLVAGWRVRYGVLDVSGCSRTQPVQRAAVDLRTLDGSHCAGPGGTIIGRVYNGQEKYRDIPVAPEVTLTFRDRDGHTYTARSDHDGIYELQHLAAGAYSLDSRMSGSQYFAGGFTVTDGVCGESDALIRHFDISGQLLPDLGYHASVRLQSFDSAGEWVHGELQSDGRFHFNNIPDGQYWLVVSSAVQGEGNDLFYPGTPDRNKATKIVVAGHQVVGPRELDFTPAQIPFCPHSGSARSPERSTEILLANSSCDVRQHRLRRALDPRCKVFSSLWFARSVVSDQALRRSERLPNC